MTVGADAKRVVIKAGAVVVNLDNTNASVSVESNGYVGEVKNKEKITGSHSGSTIKVSTFDQLQALALASTVGITLDGKTIELANDIDLTGKSWQPFGFDETHPFMGMIDGKGHTIKGLSPNGYNSEAFIKNETNGAQGTAYGFICIANNATVKNINFVDVNIEIKEGLAVGAVVGDARGNSLTIENVTVSGSVSAKDKVGGFVGLAGYKSDSTRDFTLTIKNSTNNANVNAVSTEKYNRAGGFVGGLGGTDYEKQADGTTKTIVYCKSVTFEKCTNNGNVHVTGHYAKQTDPNNYGLIVTAGGFIGQINGNTNKTFTVKDCINTGTITAVNTLTKGNKEVKGMDEGSRDIEKCVKVYPIFEDYKAN